MEPEGSLLQSQAPGHILSQINPLHVPIPLLEDLFYIISHLRLGLQSGCFPSGLPIKTLYAPLLSPIRITCPTNLILLDLITRIIHGEEYKS